MKRPLAWLCAVCIIILALIHMVGKPMEDSPPYLAMQSLRNLADSEGIVSIRGIVEECSAVSEGICLSINHISVQKDNVSKISLLSDLKITITTEDETIAPGDILEVKGKLMEFEPATNPGQFDARKWYYDQNIVCSLKRPEILMKQQGKITIARVLYSIRMCFRESYTKILGEKPARLLSAISLGEKSWLEQDWKKVYQEGGIAHILAISGLHITLIGMSLYRLLRRLGAGFPAAAVPSGILVVFYAVMSGSAISAVRAAVMFCLWLGSQICGRKYDTVTATSAAALVLLIIDRNSLTQASFLLSFGAILSLGIILPCLENAFAMEKIPLKGLHAGLAVYLGTMPCTLFFYYQTTPWSILVNLAVIPFMSSLMTAGLAAGAVGMFWVSGGIFLAAPVSYMLGFFEWLCGIEQRLPCSVLVLGRPTVWRIGVYYGILITTVLLSENYRKRKNKVVSGNRAAGHCRKLIPLWLGCGILCIAVMAWNGRKDLTITCLDVGQGDGSLIQLPTGENCLIDGGSSSKSKLWEYTISQTVKYYGIRQIDYIFLSHGDEDHINGIEEFLEEYKIGFAGRNVHGVSVKNLVLPPAQDPEDFRKLKELALGKGIRISYMESGGWIASEEGEGNPLAWRISCLAPEAAALTGDKNQDSMVLKLQYGNFSMLFTGDLEKAAEQALVRSGRRLRADVLKVGHHGSANASSAEFLTAVSPEVAIISCGKNNVYGHPAAETISRLKDAGCRILQTPENGAIILVTDGRKYTVKGYMRAESEKK